MKRSIVVMLLLIVLAGCDGIELRLDDEPIDNRQAAPIEYPTVNLPVALRQANWRGNQGEGSCVHALMISLFRWQGRYAKGTPKVPCVRIQSADGKVMYQVCGQNIPMSADALDRAIRTGIFRRRRCCPSPQPQPQPVPDPEPQPLDHVGPPDVAPEPASNMPPFWLLGVLLTLGAGAGVANKWKETYYPSAKK